MSIQQTNVLRRRVRRSLLIVCLGMVLIQAGAAARALNIPPFASLLPGWEFLAGAFWSGAFAISAYRLVRDSRSAIRWAGWLLVGFGGYTVARLFWFARAEYDRERLPFIGLVAIIMTVLLWIIDLRPILRRRRRQRTQQMETSL